MKTMATKQKVASPTDTPKEEIKQEETLPTPATDLGVQEGEKVDPNTEAEKPTRPYKISKIMIAPSRKINLGNYETLEVHAGFEVTFDKAYDVDSDVIQDALTETRKMIGKEFRAQVDAFGKAKKQPEAKK